MRVELQALATAMCGHASGVTPDTVAIGAAMGFDDGLDLLMLSPQST
jgi:hypothetical protein